MRASYLPFYAGAAGTGKTLLAHAVAAETGRCAWVCLCEKFRVWYRMHARIKNECASTRTHIHVCNTYMYACVRVRVRVRVHTCADARIVDRCISCMDYSMCRCKGSRIWARMEGGRGGEPSTARILAEGGCLHGLEGLRLAGFPLRTGVKDLRHKKSNFALTRECGGVTHGHNHARSLAHTLA